MGIVLLFLVSLWGVQGANVETPYASVELVGTNASYVIRPSTFIMPDRSNVGPGISITPCGAFDVVSNNFVVVLRMGRYVDYYRLTNLNDFYSLNSMAPRDLPTTLCTLLTTTVQEGSNTNIYDWTNDLANAFITEVPSLFRDNDGISFMGGSQQFWLRNTFDPFGFHTSPYVSTEEILNVRQTIGIWGSNINQFHGGCCYDGFDELPAWFRNYTISLILYPQLAAPLVTNSPNSAELLVSWDRSWDNSLTSYILEESVNGGSWHTVTGAPLATSVAAVYHVTTVPGFMYSYRITTLNNGARNFNATSVASAPIVATTGGAGSSTGGNSNGGGSSSTGGSSDTGTGQTGPIVVVASPANYALSPPLNGLAGVDIILREVMPGGSTGPDTIWYTWSPSDQTPPDPVCLKNQTVGTASPAVGVALFTIFQSVHVKAIACSSVGVGFVVSPLAAFSIIVKTSVPFTIPMYQEGTPDSSTLTDLVVGSAPFTFSLGSDTASNVNAVYFAYDLVKFPTPTCDASPQPVPSITVSQSSDLVAVTCQKNSLPSDVLHLRVSLKVSPVTFTLTPPDGQDLGSGVLISFSSVTDGVTFWYTTDGTTPVCGSPSNTPANNQILISSPQAFQVIGCKAGLDPSSVAVVNAPWRVADPIITLMDNLQGVVNVTIAAPTLGATLWYTLDGTDPTCSSGYASVTPPNPPLAGVSISFMLFTNTTVKALACKTLPPAPSLMSRIVTLVVNPGGGSDSDHDGVANDVDACPNSIDVGKTVVLDGCDSGVANVLIPPYFGKVNLYTGWHGRYNMDRTVAGCNYRDIFEKCLIIARSDLTSTSLKTLKGRNIEKAQDDFRDCAKVQLDFWLKTEKNLSGKDFGSLYTCVRRVRFDGTNGGDEGSSSSSEGNGESSSNSSAASSGEGTKK